MLAVVTNEDSSWKLLGRVTAEAGSGAASPIPSEGNLVEQADVSSVTVKLFDDDGIQQQTSSPAVSATIIDSLNTSGIWENLPHGGNFQFAVPLAWSATPGRYTIMVHIVYASGEETKDQVKWGVRSITD